MRFGSNRWSLPLPSSVHTARYRRLLERLREAREASGLSQTEVAKALGKPQSWVSNVEHGQRRLDVVELEMLASVYKKRMRFFIEEP